MRRFAAPFLILVCVLCVSPLGAAGKKETSDTAVRPAGKQKTMDNYVTETIHPAADGNTAESIQASGENAVVSTQAEDVPAKDMSADTSEQEDIPAEKIQIDTPPAVEASAETVKSGEADLSTTGTNEIKNENGGTASSADKDEKKDENGEPVDLTFASIHSKGLTVADGNKWYYESFDRHGRASFAVLYEDDMAVEKTVWIYKDAGCYPTQKKILRTTDSEIFFYDEGGRELTIERYEGKTLTSKTENVYNSFGKLMEQTVTAGKNTDRSIWEFAGDKAVTQTKYRNGKKTAFIELHSTPHIVHLYVDDKEVYVGEEQ